MGESIKTRRGAGSVSKIPVYTYSGNHQFIDDGNDNWRIKLTSSGTLRFAELGNAKSGVDIFLVGGGGSGAYSREAGTGGGGGGYTTTAKGKSITKNTDYWVDVGAGGAGTHAGTRNGYDGGTSQISALGVSAGGGKAGTTGNGGRGGNGGSGGGANDAKGGSDGSDGHYDWTDPSYVGIGQHTTTREFAESGATLYAGGGAGDGANNAGASAGGGGGADQNGTNGLGGGGGGSYWGANCGGAGGSGIVIIRNKR